MQSDPNQGTTQGDGSYSNPRKKSVQKTQYFPQNLPFNTLKRGALPVTNVDVLAAMMLIAMQCSFVTLPPDLIDGCPSQSLWCIVALLVFCGSSPRQNSLVK